MKGFFIFELNFISMKNLFVAFSLLFFISSYAQFRVVGELKNYSEKPILVRIFLGPSDKLINKITTDKNGKFSVKIPQQYSGIVRLVCPAEHASYDFLSDNEDIEFSAEVANEKFSDVNIKKGKTAIGYETYKGFEGLNDLKTNVFPIIKPLYSPEDDFYIAITKEEERISKLNPVSDLPLLKYYIQVSELANTQVENTPSVEVYKNKILNRLVTDNLYLEGSGLMPSLILNYLRFSIVGAASQEQINTIIEQEIDQLLVKTDLETPRGQNVLSSILVVLPVEQFTTLLEKYYTKAETLTCEITDDLKGKITAHKQMVPGNEVPNIVFEKPVKGFKSLYDIKAEKKIIIFWASWCPACRDEMPFINEYYKNFKENGGEIVAISLDFDETAYSEAIKDYQWINYTELAQWDTQGVIEYGIAHTPTLFLVDKDNKLIKTAGHISELVEL